MANAVSLPGDRLAGMQVDLLQKLRAGARTLDELDLFLQGKNPFPQTLVAIAVSVATNILTVSAQTIEEAIADGNYGWHNDLIPQKFNHDNRLAGKWEWRLAHPKRKISSKDAKTLCEEDGWQAACIEHLLAFGEAFPELKKDGPIIALSSVCERSGGRSVPVLWTDLSKRGLVLLWWVADWNSHCRFLSVRKVSGS